ncbi:hypothetical protein [Halovivax gelatinilyticus]|uniref:hypothetical protein n=1 Tax=Halovivax gelatinilyticus TaxID=2961597 RepID=UPI0020CA4B98|nr:hypothetical protein [Halovivax gelatinilyticus]
MYAFVRGAIVPFFSIFVPGVWYVNRNLTTAALAPTVDPSPGLIVAGLAGVVLVATIGAAIGSWLASPIVDSEATSLPARVLVPPVAALPVFLGCMAILGLAGAVVFLDLGPGWLQILSLALATPLALPFVVLVPLAIHSHLATIVGLACIPLWCSLGATYTAGSDVV